MQSQKLLFSLYAVPLFLAMWILYGWNYWNGDRDVYELYYQREGLIGWGAEIGYGYLNLLANRLGLTYQSFQIIVAFVTLALLLRYFVKRSRLPALSLLLYFIFFFPLDYVLMRNFLSFVLLLQGILVLYSRPTYARTKYILWVIIATSIHQSAIFFLVFLLVRSDRVFSLRKFFVIFSCFLSLYVVVRYVGLIPNRVLGHLGYYNFTLKSALFNLFVHGLSFSLVIFSIIVEKKNAFYCQRPIDASARNEKELFFILNINLFSLFFLVFYFESEIFIRLARMILFFNMFYCFESFLRLRQVSLIALIYLAVFGSYLWGAFLFPTLNLSVIPLFTKNLLLN